MSSSQGRWAEHADDSGEKTFGRDRRSSHEKPGNHAPEERRPMNRRPIPWLAAAAGAVLVVCLLLSHQQLAQVSAGLNQVGAPSPCRSAVISQLGGESAPVQVVGTDTIGFSSVPDQFLAYTFTVVVRSATCAPLQDATVALVLSMPSMPRMVPMRITLAAVGPSAPGAYQAQGVLMAGQWQALVRVSALGVAQPLQAAFPFSPR
jgi:hypothetical protein